MTHFQDKMSELKHSIDQVTQEVMGKLDSGNLDDVESMLTRRATLLAELIALTANEITRTETLREYLVELQSRDQMIINSLVKEKDEIRNTILNLNKVSKYYNI